MSLPESTVATTEAFSLRAALRDATTLAHERLDGALRYAFRDVAGYVAFLRGTHAVLATLEPVLSDLGVLAPVGGEGRAARVAADLAALGASPREITLPSLAPATRAQAFGAAYVVEGSALGGLAIGRLVEQHLGLPPGARGYVSLHGEATRARWSAFVARLDAFGAAAGRDDRARACAQAVRTFDAYAAAFRAAGLELAGAP